MRQGPLRVLFYFPNQTSKNIAEFICYLGIGVLASRMKVNLPGITIRARRGYYPVSLPATAGAQ